MFTHASAIALGRDPLNWNLLFARQPEPDLEFTDEDLDDVGHEPLPPLRPPKKSKKRPVLWLLLLLLVSAGAYVYMNPDAVMEWLEPVLDGGTPTASIPAAPRPASPPPAQTPAPTVSAPGSTDRASGEGTATAPASPTTAPAPPLSKAPSPSAMPSTPLFHEGQTVITVADPGASTKGVTLSLDSAGIQAGPVLPVGTVVTIRDGELRERQWVYSVRTKDGRTGWIDEHLLKAN